MPVRARQCLGAGRVGLPRRPQRSGAQPAGDRPPLHLLRPRPRADALSPRRAPARRASSSRRPASPIPLSAQRRWLAIPGSAGQPRDGDPAACYAMFDTERARADLPPRPLRPRGRGREGARRRPAASAWPSASAGARLRAAVAPASLEVGQVVDGFRLDALAHRGGMATLWHVSRVDPTPSSDAALPLIMKVPRLRGGDDPTAIVGFEVEQMIMPTLAGPHVPRFVAKGDFTAPALHRHGADRGPLAARALRRRAAARSTRSRGSAPRSRPRCTTCTASASSTSTSSRATSCSADAPTAATATRC